MRNYKNILLLFIVFVTSFWMLAMLAGCNDSIPKSVYNPPPIPPTPSESTTYAYITDAFESTAYKCFVESSGSLSSCNFESSAKSALNYHTPLPVVLNTAGGKKYAYIPSKNSTLDSFALILCNVESNGDLNSCTSQTSDPFESQAISISFQGESAYLASYESISQCNVNSADGTLAGCSFLPSTIQQPNIQYITLFNPTTIESAGPLLYVNSIISPYLGIYGCSINSISPLLCTQLLPQSLLAHGPVLTFRNDTTPYKVYVSSLYPNPNLLLCNISESGFSNCNTTPSSSIPNWSPVNVAIYSSKSNGYAYVSDPGGNKLYMCQSDKSGNLSSCGEIESQVVGSSGGTLSPTGVTISK